MSQLLYNVILFPLVQIIQFVYFLVHDIFQSLPQRAGFSIIGVSVAITLLCLPLYVVAEKWQQIERDTQKKLEPGINRIKAVFKGDEQYMILRTFYRQNGYHPLMALRSSFGLLIQIPFFMAAYQFLSNLEELRGLSFWFIRDLGNPDATFYIGSFPVNVLPIAMTLINCVAGAIYTKGFKARDKIQVYAMAAIFLVILYDSPAGLVLYWTMNNVFSMVKNIFYKLKNPLLVLYLCACAGVALIEYYLLFIHIGPIEKRLAVVAVFALIFFIPLFLKLITWILDKPLRSLVADKRATLGIFISSACVLVSVLGLQIITSVIASSPLEFSFIDDIASPFTYIRGNVSQMLGLFAFWPLCIYFLFGDRVKVCFSVLYSLLAVCVLINVFAFAGDYGNVNATMIFDNPNALNSSVPQILLNLAVMAAGCVIVFVFLWFRKYRWVSLVFSFATVGVLLSAFISFPGIKKEFDNYAEQVAVNGQHKEYISPVFHLSKTGKNIFVIDLDRGMNAFIPQIFAENPELDEIYSGFTYYPNTFSYSVSTIAASPAMFGGYDYDPQHIMARDTEDMLAKHTEALTAIPLLFSDNDFAVTVTDMSFAGYSWAADMRMYDQYPGIRGINTERVYAKLWLSMHPEAAEEVSLSVQIKNNMFWYEVLRMCPYVIRPMVYNTGDYWNAENAVSTFHNAVENYSVLDLMPELTDFTEERSTYTFMVNDFTHEPIFLQYPEYVPVSEVTEFGDGPYAHDDHYHANAAAFLRIGEWIQYLKDNGVYDNTRIIMVSDHGAERITDQRVPQNGTLLKRAESINPILMIKDFGATGAPTTDKTFMTTGDVAALSCENVIENPRNPFTGNPIDYSGKEGGIYGVLLSEIGPGSQNKTTFKISNWYKTSTDIFSADAYHEVTQEEAMGAIK